MAEWKSNLFPDGCRHCGDNTRRNLGRHLCSKWYQNLEIRNQYPTTKGNDDVETSQIDNPVRVPVVPSDSDDPVMDFGGLVENQSPPESVGDDTYTGERPPGFGTSAPPREDAPTKPRGLKGLFSKKEPRQQAAPAPDTKEKKPKVTKMGRRQSAAETIGDLQSGLGGLLVRSGNHRPLGTWLQFSSAVNGEILDDAVKGTAIDRLILQPVAKGRGKFDAVGAVFGPPAIIYAIEKDPSKADALIPLLKSSIRNALPLMAPAIKKVQKREQEILEAAQELGFDVSNGQDPADEIIAMLFAGWEPPAPVVSEEPTETEEETPYATSTP